MVNLRERGSRKYFGRDPYPFDMALVEQRDGAPLREMVRRTYSGRNTVIDAGCGYGRYTEALVESADTVIALDHSFACVMRTQDRASNALGICGDVSALPFASASVDGVISLYSSVGLDGVDLAQQISEFTRITTSGGRLLLDVAGPGSVGFSFGIEHLPKGLGLFIRFGRKGRQSQYNLALSILRVNFYRLLYSTYCLEDIREVLDPGWLIEEIAGDYGDLPYLPDSPRLIVNAVRL